MSEFTGNPESGFGGTYADGVIFWASTEGSGVGANAAWGDVFPPWTATITPLTAASRMGDLGGLANTLQILVTASTTTDEYTQAGFPGLLFDTSTIPSDATVSAVTLKITGALKGDEFPLGTGANLVVTGFAPADGGTFVAGDFKNTGTTNYGSLAYSSFNAAGANTITLDTSCVTKAGLTKLSVMFADMFSGTLSASWASGAQTYVNFYSAETATAADRPLLTVTYTEASGAVTTSMLSAISLVTRFTR